MKLGKSKMRCTQVWKRRHTSMWRWLRLKIDSVKWLLAISNDLMSLHSETGGFIVMSTAWSPAPSSPTAQPWSEYHGSAQRVLSFHSGPGHVSVDGKDKHTSWSAWRPSCPALVWLRMLFWTSSSRCLQHETWFVWLDWHKFILDFDFQLLNELVQRGKRLQKKWEQRQCIPYSKPARSESTRWCI